MPARGGASIPPSPELAAQLGPGHPVLCISRAIRRIIYTTDAVEALNAKLRRAVNARPLSPDEAAIKLLYLACEVSPRNGKCRRGRFDGRVRDGDQPRPAHEIADSPRASARDIAVPSTPSTSATRRGSGASTSDLHRHVRQLAFAKPYDLKMALTAADLLNDGVVPFYDAQEVKLTRMLKDRTEYAATRSITSTSSTWPSRTWITPARRPGTRRRMEPRALPQDGPRRVLQHNEERAHQGRWCFGKQTFLDAVRIARTK
jgi:hypothetical protein